jgi:hypothetical protein
VLLTICVYENCLSQRIKILMLFPSFILTTTDYIFLLSPSWIACSVWYIKVENIRNIWWTIFWLRFKTEHAEDYITGRANNTIHYHYMPTLRTLIWSSYSKTLLLWEYIIFRILQYLNYIQNENTFYNIWKNYIEIREGWDNRNNLWLSLKKLRTI